MNSKEVAVLSDRAIETSLTDLVEYLRAVEERHMEIFTSAGPKTLTHVYTDKGDYKTYQVTSSIISNYRLIRDTILSKAITIGK